MGTPSHSYGTSLAIWDHTVLPATRSVKGKSQLRFDLNRDWIASRDSIWPLRIQFSSLRFEIWFDLGLFEIRFSICRFGTKSYGNEPGAVADMRVSVAADHKWPTRNILKLYFVRWLSPPFIAWQQSTSAFQQLMMTNLMIFVAVGYTLIVSIQDIWSTFEIWVIKIWDSGFLGDLGLGFATKDLRFYVWRFGIWHARFDLGFAHHCTRHKWTRPALTPASKLVRDLPTPEGWKAEWSIHRPRVELAIFRSLVRRPTTTLPSHPTTVMLLFIYLHSPPT